MQLPKFGTTDKSFALLQTQWAKFIDPILSLPMVQQNTLKNVVLTSGTTNRINHGLGRELQGWFIIRLRASATVYDTQDSNQTPQYTLQLVTSANVTVDLVVF